MAALMDWRDTTRADKIIFQMVNPSNIDAVMGELEGVELNGATLSAGYYTDTRTSGKIHVVGEGWKRGSFVRVIHQVPEWNYSRELGTYLVTNDDRSRELGTWGYDLTLQSLLFGLSTDKLVRPWVIANNAMMMKAAAQCLDATGYRYNFAGAADYRFKGARVMETGTDRLSIMYALSKLGNNRIDIDGHGRVTMSKYLAPSAKVPVFRIDLNDQRGVAIDGLSGSTDFLEIPNVVGVCYKHNTTRNGKSVQQEINASAQVSSSSPHAHGQRGYTVTDFRELSEISPATAARAQQLAQQYLANDSIEHVEWQLTTIYLPIWEGDVVDLVIHDGEKAYQGVRRCLVKNVELKLQDMTMQLTLKEVTSGDDED